MTWLSYLLILYGASWAGVGIFRWYAVQKGLLDKPNNRSSHTIPTPRGGGVVCFLLWTVLLGVFYYYRFLNINWVLLFIPALLVGIVGFVEDFKNISAASRFICHCVAMTILLLMFGDKNDLVGLCQQLPIAMPLPVAFVGLVFAMVWMINLYNFMDGSDGLAAVQAMFIFIAGGYFLYQYNAMEMVVLAWGLAAILAGFLTWNWPPARIFMGDSGSYFLGALISSYAIISYREYHVSLIIWIILTSPFWFDATITLLRRILAREEWTKPHRKHAYQRLIQAGWSHQQLLFASIVVNVILCGLAYLVYYDPRFSYFSFIVTVSFLTCVYLLAEIIKPMYKTWYQV